MTYLTLNAKYLFVFPGWRSVIVHRETSSPLFPPPASPPFADGPRVIVNWRLESGVISSAWGGSDMVVTYGIFWKWLWWMRGQRRGQKGVGKWVSLFTRHPSAISEQRKIDHVDHNEAVEPPATLLNQSVGHANHCIAIKSRVAALPNIYNGDINTIHSFSTPFLWRQQK